MRHSAIRRSAGALALACGLTACSGATEDAASPDGTENSSGSGGDAADSESGGPADKKAQESLATALIPVEEAGYTCTDKGASPSGAARATCTNDSEIDIEAFAWVDAERKTTAYASEVRCRDGSPLTQLTSLQGDTWVLALVSGDKATVDSQGAIDVLSVSLQEATTSPVAIQPCVAPEPPPPADTAAPTTSQAPPADTAAPASSEQPPTAPEPTPTAAAVP